MYYAHIIANLAIYYVNSIRNLSTIPKFENTFNFFYKLTLPNLNPKKHQIILCHFLFIKTAAELQ